MSFSNKSILFFIVLFTINNLSMATDFLGRRYQRLEIGNSGTAIVRDFKIAYGELIIPHGSHRAP